MARFSKLFQLSTLRKQFIIPILAIIIPLFFISFIFLNIRIGQNITRDINKTISGNVAMFFNNIQRIEKKALLVSSAMSEIEGIENIYRQGNTPATRVMLRRLSAPCYNSILRNAGLKQLQVHFHSRPARSFLRLWREPGKNDGGDDISAFRQSVLDVSKNRKPITTVEDGR